MEKPRECPLCGNKFDPKLGVEVNVLGKKYFACPRCGTSNRSRIFPRRDDK